MLRIVEKYNPVKSATQADINSAINGTTNYIPLFTSAHALGNSFFSQNGTNVKLGTASNAPQARLEVEGTGGTNSTAGLRVISSSFVGLRVGDDGLVEALKLKVNRNIYFENQSSDQSIVQSINDPFYSSIDCTTASKTVTLLSAATADGGFFCFTKTDSSQNNLRLIPGVGGQTINGELYYTLYFQNQSVIIYSDGSNWFVLSDNRRYGTLYYSSTDVATTAVTTEETLASYTLKGGLLAKKGEQIKISAVVQIANNANNKTIRCKLGSTTILSTTSSFNNFLMLFEIWIKRDTATQQYTIGKYHSSLASSIFIQETAPTETLGNDLTIAFTGQNAVASAGDITLKDILIEKIPSTYN